ncbi:MAG: cytochrome c [Acidobacteria bacterium]|nr:cytochrome c [Acidobacteriota bacterium]
MNSWKTVCRAAVMVLFISCLLSLALRVAAHEPITTKVRFNKEVVRILARSCLSCHRPGGIAPFSLATYDEARPWAKAIKEEMLERRMPVWHVVKGYGEFRNAPRLTQREIELLVNWVEGGAPRGEEKDYPSTPVYTDDWALGKPDAVLALSQEQKVAADTDEVRTFSLPTNFKEERWLRALDVRPTNGAVVLSATLYMERTSSSSAAATAAVTNAAPSDSGLAFATWMPGQQVIALPDGVARLIPAYSRLVVKIHYRGNGEAATDRSAVGLYFAKTPPRKVVRDVAITDAAAVIPAGPTAHPLKASFTITEDSEAIAIRPFENSLMISFQASAFLPDGSERVLIWSRGNKYDWQPTYYFKSGVRLPKGTHIEVTAYFDNSDDNQNNPHDPAKALRWSEITHEPLCDLMIATSRRASTESVSLK